MRLFESEPGQLRRLDFLLALLVFALAGIGIAVIWGASGKPWSQAGLARSQTTWVILGACAFLFCCFVNLRTLEWASWPIYLMIVATLIWLAFFGGEEVRGARAWLQIGPRRVQPSEFAKVAVVLVMASYLSLNRDNLDRVSGLIVPAVLCGLPMALVIMQNDLGTAVVFAPIFLAMVFMAGVRKRILTMFFAIAGLGVVLALPQLQTHHLARISQVLGPRLSEPFIRAVGRQPERIFEFADEYSGYQRDQTLVALGSGRLFGKGWGKGTQTALRVLPDSETDTIFASLGEQFGMIGCLGLVALYALVVMRGSRIAHNARDMFCSLMTMGLLTIFVTHVIINAGMNIDLLPVIGIPLPFLSAGGSFLLTLFVMFGLIVNVGMRRYVH